MSIPLPYSKHTRRNCWHRDRSTHVWMFRGGRGRNPLLAILTGSTLKSKAHGTPHNLSLQTPSSLEDKSQSLLKVPHCFRRTNQKGAAEVRPHSASRTAAPLLCHPQLSGDVSSHPGLACTLVQRLCGQQAHLSCHVYTSLLFRR